MTAKQPGQLVARLVLPVWALLLMVVIASLMANHWVSLPHPALGATVTVTDLSNPSSGSVTSLDDSRWFALHVLFAECPCSRRVLKHVVSREPLSGVRERIVFIGKDEELQQLAIHNGYEIECLSAEELGTKYGIESAPLLLVTEPSGTIRYSGGYTPRKQGLDIQDAEIISNTLAGKTVTELPVYGCAVSQNLKAIVDPFGLK